MKDFMQGAGGLTKNPLGVVGLFLCLVYGVACVVFLVSGKELVCGERWVLVWFVALFPCVILLVFYILVTRHHNKLYAPSDYKDEQNFMMMSEARITMRLDEQIEKDASPVNIKTGQSGKLGPGLVARQGKTNNVYFNLDEKKAKRAEYGDAKRLAFLAIEKSIGRPFVKFVKFTVDGKEMEFDGYLEVNDEMHIIDVIYLQTPEKISDYVSDFVRKSIPVFERSDEARKMRKKIWFGVVYAFSREELQASGVGGMPVLNYSVQNFMGTHALFLNLDELKSTYG